MIKLEIVRDDGEDLTCTLCYCDYCGKVIDDWQMMNIMFRPSVPGNFFTTHKRCTYAWQNKMDQLHPLEAKQEMGWASWETSWFISSLMFNLGMPLDGIVSDPKAYARQLAESLRKRSKSVQKANQRSD
jgi:hypothetical protein